MKQGSAWFIQPKDRVEHRFGLWQGPAIVQLSCWSGHSQLICVKTLKRQIFSCNAKEVKPCPNNKGRK